MNARELRGIAVMVTRPEQQAEALCGLLETRGATVIRLPVIKIRPAPGRHESLEQIGPIDAFDWLIFTSANAVKFGLPLLATLRASTHASLPGPLKCPKFAAIGPATARALREAGVDVSVTATTAHDSERLLEQPELQHVAGHNVIIVKGLKGRHLLQDELAQRGANVVLAEVYERERVRYSQAALAALEASLAGHGLDIVTATSTDIAEGLLELATPALERELRRAHWLVPSRRAALALRERGLTAPILEAPSAEDHALVATIARWRSSASGA